MKDSKKDVKFIEIINEKCIDFYKMRSQTHIRRGITAKKSQLASVQR